MRYGRIQEGARDAGTVRRIEEMDRSFDIEFWQAQGPSAIFGAAWWNSLTGTKAESWMTSDFNELLRAFNDWNVRYLLIGDHAVMHRAIRFRSPCGDVMISIPAFPSVMPQTPRRELR